MLKIKFGTTFFWKQNKLSRGNNYHYYIQLHLFLFFLKKAFNKNSRLKKSSPTVFYKVKRKQSHDTMLLKASFKHKVPKHILTRQVNKAFFEISTKAKFKPLLGWEGFNNRLEVDADFGAMFFVPGTSTNFMSISSPLNINKLMFLNV